MVSFSRPEPIAFERIGARKIEDEVGLMAVQDLRQVRAQQRKYSSSPVPSSSGRVTSSR